MEHSQKNTDCYFFYYSTCRKGDSCPFRHEPSALGCETMCSYWQQGNCLNEHCNFRHMELKKNRKLIPCYWETQPGGCRKPHCSFLHKNARTITGEPINPVKTSDVTSKSLNQEWLNRTEDTKYDGCSTESDQGRGSSEAGSFIGSPAVDPLIVKFEEESDNESIASPAKPQPAKRVSYCKTYEEIRLEEIQAESAAYYSYEVDHYRPDPAASNPSKTTTTRTTAATTAATGITPSPTSATSASKRVSPYSAAKPTTDKHERPDFKVLTLEEIRQRKKLKQRIAEEEDMLRNANGPSSTRPLKRRRIEALDVSAAGKMEEDEPEEELEEEPEGTEDRRKRKTRVPPVRLKRSIRRLQHEQSDEDPSSASRKKEVEVRLCDSSTDEASREEKKAKLEIDGKSSHVFCDSLLNITEDEYLALDTASDDILKDIDAILKEKTPV